MHVGGVYFMNHKTTDYFPEGAGLLNLSIRILKQQKSHDSHWMIHIIIENIIIGNTQSAHDVPGMSPEDLLKVLTSGTCKGHSGNQYKN